MSSKDNAMALMFMAACWSRSAQWLQSGHVAVRVSLSSSTTAPLPPSSAHGARQTAHFCLR